MSETSDEQYNAAPETEAPLDRGTASIFVDRWLWASEQRKSRGESWSFNQKADVVQMLLDSGFGKRSSAQETGPKPDAEKDPVSSGDWCPTGNWRHLERNGKCIYCGAPMLPGKASTELRCAICTKTWEEHKTVITHNFKHKPAAKDVDDGNIVKPYPGYMADK